MLLILFPVEFQRLLQLPQGDVDGLHRFPAMAAEIVVRVLQIGPRFLKFMDRRANMRMTFRRRGRGGNRSGRGRSGGRGSDRSGGMHKSERGNRKDTHQSKGDDGDRKILQHVGFRPPFGGSIQPWFMVNLVLRIWYLKDDGLPRKNEVGRRSQWGIFIRYHLSRTARKSPEERHSPVTKVD